MSTEAEDFRVTPEQRQALMHHLQHFMPPNRLPSEEGFRCALLLARLVGGLHHADFDGLREADWTGRFVSVPVTERFATYDFNYMTKLVVLSHDLCIRCELQAVGRNRMVLNMHPRTTRTGEQFDCHPTLEAAVEKLRPKSAPADSAE